MLKQAVFSIARFSGINRWLRSRTRSAFRVVTYHGVDEQDHPVVNFDRLQIKPGLFTRQVESLARTYRIVSLREAVQSFLAGRVWPEGALAITFDDGYLNNLEVAAPILQRLGLPATFFVTAGFLDGRARPWWYDVREMVAAAPATELLLPGEPARDLRTVAARRGACRALEWAWAVLPEEDRGRRLVQLQEATQVGPPVLRYPFMSGPQARLLVERGFDVEPHGDTHCSLLAEGQYRVRDEVQRSAQHVRNLTGREPCCLAWPYGHVPATRALAEEALAAGGLQAGLGVKTGWNDERADRVVLRRWDLHGGYSVEAVQARLSGFTSWLRPEGGA